TLIVSAVIGKLLDHHIVRGRSRHVEHLAAPPGDNFEKGEIHPVYRYQLPLLVRSAMWGELLELRPIGRIGHVQGVCARTGNDGEERSRMIETIINRRIDN